MPKYLKITRLRASNAICAHSAQDHTRNAPSARRTHSTTATVKLRLQAILDFHVYEPPLLLLHARSNSHDMSALASQVRHTRQQHSTAAATVALHVYAGGASARAGRARAATAAARARARAPAHPSPRGWARRARTRRAVATPSCSAVVMSTRRLLHYGAIDDPCKMTYSRMAFFSRPCDSREARAKSAAHVHTQQLSEHARVSSSSGSQHAHEWPWHKQ